MNMGPFGPATLSYALLEILGGDKEVVSTMLFVLAGLSSGVGYGIRKIRKSAADRIAQRGFACP